MTGRLGALGGALLICACSTAAAQAAQSAKLQVSVSPDRLGASTTLAFGFQIEAPEGALPAALTQLDVRLPPGMGVNTLGLATCSEAKLEKHGPRSCSSNAQVGAGRVKVQLLLGSITRPEIAALTVFNGPRKGGHTTLVFDAIGKLPIATQFVFTGVIVPGPQGDSIEATIPLIPVLPNTPDGAIVEMTASLGTRSQTYYRTAGGRRVRFTPKGATLPASCPAGGFPFSATFGFNNGSSAAAASTVACPG
ncbi:MAG TPA: hypothetical protein VIJ66_05010 [Solirubrobacteraceae bacterium]